jgi:hypothetical protein
LTARGAKSRLLPVRSGRPSGSPDLAFFVSLFDTAVFDRERRETEMGFLKKLFSGLPGTDDDGTERATAPESHEHDHEHEHDRGEGAHTHDEPSSEDAGA